MKKIAIVNQKGGAGKSTTAVHLADQYDLDGERVVLVDADPQGSAMNWSSASDECQLTVMHIPKPTLQRDVPKIDADVVIIDCPAKHDAITYDAVKAADVILIPVQPSAFDVWATAPIVSFIRERKEITDGKPIAAFLLSRVIANTKLARDVQVALEELGLPILPVKIHQRQAYANVIGSGRTALDENNPAAHEEIALLKEAVEALFGAIK